MTLSAIPVEFQAPSTGLLKSTDTENIVGSWLGNFFVSGFTPSAVNSSVHVVTGICMLEGHWVSEGTTYVIPFVASGTYVWLQLVRSGGAGTPVTGAQYVAQATTPNDALVICSYVDNGSAVTSVSDLRQPAPLLKSLQGGASGDIYYATQAGELKKLAIGNTNQILTVSGGLPAWLANSAIQNFRTTADTTSTNGTKSTGVLIALQANTNYIFEAHLIYTSSGGGNDTMNFQIHALASGASLVFAQILFAVNSIGTSLLQPQSNWVTSVTTNMLPAADGAGGSSGWAHFWGLITVGTTSTTLQIDLVDTQSNEVIKAGSNVTIFPIT